VNAKCFGRGAAICYQQKKGLFQGPFLFYYFPSLPQASSLVGIMLSYARG